jgi:hypothetical protein
MSRCLLSINQLYIIVEVKLDRNGENDLICVRSLLAAPEGFVWESLIWAGEMTVDNLAKVFFVLVHCCSQQPNQFQILGPNCSYCVNSKKVLKSFDYRSDLISKPKQIHKRLADLYGKLLQAKVDFSSSDDLVIISYNHVPGSHIPCRIYPYFASTSKTSF